MSSIISFDVQPSTTTQGATIHLNTLVTKAGNVVFELKNTNSVKFGNNSNTINQSVSNGTNSCSTSLRGASGIVRIYAYFTDEPGQERDFDVILN